MKEKGQAQMFIIILIAVGIILFLNWTKIKQSATPEISVGQTQTQTPISKNNPSITLSPSKNNNSSTNQEKQQKTEIPADKNPPLSSDPKPVGSLPSNTLKTTISLKTDEIATCRYSVYENVDYDAMFNFFQNTDSTFHSTEITTLSSGKEFKFYVKCADKAGNKNSDDFLISFKVEEVKDTTPPERRYLSPEGILPAGTKSTTLTVTTDEKAYCYYSTYQGKDFWSGSRSFSQNETQTYHTSIVSGLEDGRSYDFFVRCVDLAGNSNTGDVLIRFQVASP